MLECVGEILGHKAGKDTQYIVIVGIWLRNLNHKLNMLQL